MIRGGAPPRPPLPRPIRSATHRAQASSSGVWTRKCDHHAPFFVLFLLLFLCDELEHLFYLANEEVSFALVRQGGGAACSLQLFRKLGRCVRQPRLLRLVATLDDTSVVVVTCQLILKMIDRGPDRRQRQQILGDVFVDRCLAALLVAQFPGRHGEQQSDGERSPLLLDMVGVDHGNRPVASRCCCSSMSGPSSWTQRRC